MNERYDTDRADPETVRALLQRVLAKSEPFGDVVAKLRGECRVPRARADIAVELCSKLGSSAYGWGPDWAAHTVTFNLPKGVGPELLDLVVAFKNAEDPPPSSRPNTLTDHDRDVRPARPTEWASVTLAGPEGIPHTRPEEVPTEPEACGCEEVESLKAQIAALRARNYDLAMQVSHIRKLARAPEVQALFEEIDREP